MKFMIPLFARLLFIGVYFGISSYTTTLSYKKIACNDFHKRVCMSSPDDGFAYNGQSKSGLMIGGQSTSLKVVFYRGMDYHISVCAEDNSQANFIIKDAKTQAILYNNATDSYLQEIELSNENTRSVIIQLSVVAHSNNTLGKCCGVLIEHRRTKP